MLTQKETLLKTISIFSDLTAAELKKATALMAEHEKANDTILFKEGDTGREMFVILEGKVAITVHVTGVETAELVLAEMGPGSFFGEMSLTENVPRSATCRILEKSRLLCLDHTALLVLMQNHSVIAQKILYRMLTTTTSRLHNTSALLNDMVQWGEKARLRVITDEFTGLFNRRFLDESLLNEFRKAAASHTALSVAMVDLDHFSEANRKYGEAFGDTIILKAADVFRSVFRPGDILSRYGGDEFSFLLPGTHSEEALSICATVCEELEETEIPEHPDYHISASIGIATFPEHAQTLESLLERADKALYAAKEGGRNQAVTAKKVLRQKHSFSSIAERNHSINRILDLIRAKNNFLLLGHELPDEDCIASLVSMALLIMKFGKTVTIYIRDQIPDQLSYLANICTYNKIPLLQGSSYDEVRPDVVCVLDTPKPEMIASNPDISSFLADPGMPVIEFDHHLSADAAYSGTPGYCLVNRASSTCELIAMFCCKLNNRKDILQKFNITDLFTRNLVLSMITGMIGDTRFGMTMKNHRDTFFYNLFSDNLATLLRDSVRKNSGNYSSMHDIFKTMQSFSFEEKMLYEKLLERAHYFGMTGYVVLDNEESKNYLSRTDYTLFVKVIKSVTDFLAEKSGTIGLTAYYDMSDVSDLIQFRIRTSRNVTGIDLRSILVDFSIADGGGHPGAVGFRIPKSQISDFNGYISDLLKVLETV